MPEGNKSRVSGDGVESNRPATNFPGFSVGSDRIGSGRSCGWKELSEELISDNAKLSEPPLPTWH